MLSEVLKKAVEYANYRYYSKPMSVVNVKKLQLPIRTPLKEIKTADGTTFHVRSSHGLPHVLPAMELIPSILEYYDRFVLNFPGAMEQTANYFQISRAQLEEYVQLAVLFHDSAREGDGMDLWDPQSADACKKYLIEQLEINDLGLVEFIADTIRFKDEPKEFTAKYQHINAGVDFIRQLVNTADTLEVIRTRDVFKPEYMPIANLVSKDVMQKHIIPGLVVPHRQLISDQGRLKKEGKIVFNGVESAKQAPHPESQEDRLTATYLAQSEQYNLSILEIKQENLNLVVKRAIRGIDAYLAEHQSSGVQLFHNGFFSPRYHGETGINRAKYYKNKLLEDKEPLEKVKVLYALFASYQGPTLKDEVVRSFNQYNQEKIKSDLKNLLKTYEHDGDLDTDIGLHVAAAEGVKPT